MNKNEWDSEWLYFSRRARRGVFVLLGLFMVIAIIPRLYYNYVDRNSARIFEVVNSEEENTDNLTRVEQPIHNQSKFKIPTESFNPNDFGLTEWMTIGFSEKQAQSILNYRNRYGDFKQKEDLKKLFVMSDELYQLLENKITLPEVISFNSNKEKEAAPTVESFVEESLQDISENENRALISINRATEKELQTIKGIGPFYAKEIVKLRNQYGGIHSPNQLLVIYNLEEEDLEKIKPFLVFNKDEIIKLNINQSTADDLAKHPLISSDIARSIVYFRDNYKPYQSLDELLLSPYIDRELLRELTPYLTVE